MLHMYMITNGAARERNLHWHVPVMSEAQCNVATVTIFARKKKNKLAPYGRVSWGHLYYTIGSTYPEKRKRNKHTAYVYKNTTLS